MKDVLKEEKEWIAESERNQREDREKYIKFLKVKARNLHFCTGIEAPTWKQRKRRILASDMRKKPAGSGHSEMTGF